MNQCEQVSLSRSDPHLNPAEPHSTNPIATLPSQAMNIDIHSVQYLDTKACFVVESRGYSDLGLLKIYRNYEDFRALHECLCAASQLSTIIPPLPELFDADDRKLSPNLAKILTDCKYPYENAAEFVQYLSAVLQHPLLSSNATVGEFLTKDKFSPPQIEAVKSKERSIFKSVTSLWKANPNRPDCDDFYEKERSSMQTFGDKLGDVKLNFETLIASNRKLCNVVAHLSTCITSTLVINEQQTQSIQMTKLFCTTLDHYQEHLDAAGALGSQILGAILQYLLLYNLAYKDMLSRRTELMIKYENANKTYQRQMGTKHSEKAESEKKQAELEFEQISERARPEIKHYNQYCKQVFTKSINHYAESQLAMSKQTVALLKSCIANFKSINV